VEAKELNPVPYIMLLKKIDFWYWCRYFIDFFNECPYRCSYCNTRERKDLRGIEFLPGIPPEREIVGLGLLSDLYHPDFRGNRLVTGVLETLYKRSYPVTIITKSDQIIENIHILKKLSERKSIQVTLTILTLDEAVSEKIEGRSPSPQKRLKALKTLTSEGIPAGVALTPIIPFINDNPQSLKELVLEVKKNGASWVLFSGFSPVPTFLCNPAWKQTADIHNKPAMLEEHYRKIKNFMIKLLLDEGISMRIPRMYPDLIYRGRSSAIVSEYLFNISYFYELMENHLEAMRYRRAAYTLERLMQPLKSIVSQGKHGYIRGINPEIEKVMEEVLYTGSSSTYLKLQEKLGATV